LHRAHNYGAVFQTYALYQTLKKLGYEVEIIDFIRPEIYGYYDYKIFSKPVNVKNIIRRVIRYKNGKSEKANFSEFLSENVALSPRITNEHMLINYCKKYDGIICGSDQVWNKKANGGLLNIYLLNFKLPKRIKKVSYAASCGNASLIDQDITYYRKCLNKFDSISVREEDLQNKLLKITNKDIKLLVDPTLLLKKQEWLEIKSNINTPNQYLLVYFLNENEQLLDFINYMSNYIKIICIGKKIKNKRVINLLQQINSSEFIDLYDKAKYVVTNSFHGTIFSIIFNKKFITFGNANYNSRMATVLKKLSLEERFISQDINNEEIFSLLDTDAFFNSEIIDEEFKKSIDFLSSLNQ
jgi:hypothetical protein